MRKIFQTERSINKIFSLRWYPSSTGLYGVIAKLTADESIKVKKKKCCIFTLLGMFVMLLLFHLSLGDGQCS